MRLTAIKMAGFKSFVEPTVIHFPSNLLGIVGPNGCGKSNVIDAVRWVMGEGSARQLRGESMSDVIFSGSSGRKPVAMATVELVFDNSDGRAGGEFARYNEISVKRQVGRDGISAYFLNGTRCRRKDITDLFLGTGLGPRSYAIIEQGMINQVVEARPEELRAYLEEAAGISRYKERRRETESRIQHTRENLDRLADLREEVGKQLARLKRQARAAERYRKMRARRRADEARLTALLWREVMLRAEAAQKGLKTIETRLQAALARQRAAEKDLDALRGQQHERTDAAARIQGELYEVGGQIARLEQAIEHQRELFRRQQSEHGEIEIQLNELKQHLVLDRGQIEEITSSIGRLEPELERARTHEATALKTLEEAEQALAAARERWQAGHDTAAASGQQVELLKLRITHLDERMALDSERMARMDGGGEGTDAGLDSELEAARAEISQLKSAVGSAQQAATAAEAGVAACEEQIESARDRLEQLRALRHENLTRLESLELVNRGAEPDPVLKDWLEKRGLGDAGPLLAGLEVREPWARAVETVLSEWLQALPVKQIGDDLLRDLPDTEFGLVRGVSIEARPGTLAEQARGAGALITLLNRVRLAPDLEAARELLSGLAPEESVITPDGVWLGAGWLRRSAAQGAKAGRLARQGEIRALDGRIRDLDGEVDSAARALADARAALEQAHAGRDAKRADLEDLRRRLAEAEGVQVALANRIEARTRRRESDRCERDELETRLEKDRSDRERAAGELEKAVADQGKAAAAADVLKRSLRELETVRDQARLEHRQARAAREDIALKLESRRAGLESLRQSISRMDNQVGQLQARYLELSEELGKGDEPERAQREERDRLLETRLGVEERLKAARVELDELEQAWRERDRERQEAATEVDAIRNEQSEAQVALKEVELKADGLAERVAALDGDLEALVAELPEDADAAAWQAELERMDERIRRLEPVNLAAIEEYEAETERKDYLDRQHQDLVEALETLEQAMHRIDRTTRTRFRETFEGINKNLEALFPRLFGGGHAYLDMAADDWLNAGVTIMARPPGKRVTRIHLLSGGEKALTAVAFVFAIFNLNPAPFCLLDEVDAPLDDANVGRFSELLREMSERVQFVIVTHNKLTMEITHQMIGVTMHEPGVSRLVSVDLDRAVAMAAS